MNFGLSERNLAIDFGSSTTLIYEQGKGIINRQATVVAVDRYNGKISKYGEDARRMLGRTPADMVAIHPVSGGVVSDYEMAAMYLKEMLGGISGFTFMKPCVLAVVPSNITGVEERATIDACIEAGARRVYLVEKSLAAAVGYGYDVSQPDGHLVIDIGGGSTEVSVISGGGVVRCESIKFGGNDFDTAVVNYIRKTYGLLIGRNTAEELKKNIGTIIIRSDVDAEHVSGRSVTSSAPKELEITTEDMRIALHDPMQRVLDAVSAVLETTPPDLSGDLKKNGILLCGGGCLLYGMAPLIEEITGIETVLADDAVSCAAFGAGKMLENLDDMQEGMRNFYRKRQLKPLVY